MKTLYFDCFSGASGDMIVGALLDAGASFDRLQQQLARLPIQGYQLTAEKIRKQNFGATRFHVQAGQDQAHRHLHHVLKILSEGQLPPAVLDNARQIFTRLAEAEAAAHNSTIEKVHFHEVGAIDAIIDITAACLAIAELQPNRIACSPIPTGSGTIRCAHGVMPVPAPGTAALLKNCPIYAGPETTEMTTPTGAAILTTLCHEFGPLPAMQLEQIGYGAGSRDGVHQPNLLRVLMGQANSAADGDTVAQLEAAIDDQTPETIAYAVERFLQQGALDAYTQPIYMKKGRSGILLTLLCRPSEMETFEELIFAETTTLGLRRQIVQRRVLQRRYDTVELAGGTVRIKLGEREGYLLTAAPEYEDCRRLAEQSGQPLRNIMADALAAWNKRGT
ncbi:MAG: Pyridinium-3,5-bisthiocarboxylic acid mononucleotide nickel insertion protein [Phycisphaerae bacterium]|nr:Pyridinium-3,5-bisthiocarboxylic acid mononucleotide nickel insertion protein [Phycisphaerae bacterium]